MSDVVTVIKEVVTIVPSFQDKIMELAGKLEDVIANNASDAWSLAMYVVRVDAVINIVLGIFLIIVSLVCIKIGLKSWRWGKDQDWENGMPAFCVAACILTFCGFSIASMATATVFIWSFFYLHTPELSIARKIIESVL